MSLNKDLGVQIVCFSSIREKDTETTPKAVIRQFFYALPLVDHAAAACIVLGLTGRFFDAWTANFIDRENFP